MDAAEILLGKAVDRLAGEGGAVAVDHHGGALSPLPARSLQRQERLDGVAYLLRTAGDAVHQFALIGEPALQPAELAIVMRAQRGLEVFVAVKRAVQERAFEAACRHQRQATRFGDAREHRGDGAVEPHVGQHQHLGQLQVRTRQYGKEIFHHADGIVAVEQRRAKRTERARPGPHDRDAERHGGPLDRERHQKTQPVLVFVAVADDREPHLAVLQPGHGRRQETRIEEDVRLDGAGAEIVELVDEVETGGRLIDGEPAQRTVAFQKLDVSGIDGLAGQPGEPGDHGAGRATARFLQKRNRGHQREPPAGAKIAMTMPSLFQTVKESAAASNTIEAVVAIAAPQRPKAGISATLSAMLSASVIA